MAIQAGYMQASYLQLHKRQEHMSERVVLGAAQELCLGLHNSRAWGCTRVVLGAAQESDLHLLGRSMVHGSHQSGLP